MNETLKQIERFHGHLGPYAIIGYKMGEIANKTLGSDPFSKKAVVWTGTTPPLSCIIDGLQMSSGCTLGKGNILVRQEDSPKVQFTNNDGKQIEITLKPAIKQEIDTTVTEENIVSFSEKFYRRTDQELFDISQYM
ncbi:MAG: formylmethanofuran dehydrogenase subunit E family protein [Thermoplasmatales archaeon]|nr:formylmethanofuran dehydrogenase subunit E family protein [Thermoplasmatales archaeon]